MISQLKLLHIDHSQHLSGGTQHLSYGEKNAFSLVLFMYECLAKKPFIQCEKSVSWIDWQTKGYEFIELSDNCPFCTSDATDKKETDV